MFGPSMPAEVILTFADKAEGLPRVEHMLDRVFGPGKLFQPSLIFVRLETYPRVEHLKGASFG